MAGVDIELSHKFLKSLGLLAIFSKKGSALDLPFFIGYFKDVFSENQVDDTIKRLEKAKIIRFSRFDSSFKLTEGTDLDIEKAIMDAERQIDSSIDILSKLNSHFDFPIITAKAITYRLGTPRLFEFLLTNLPANQIPLGEIDGFVNLIFSEKEIIEEYLIQHSKGKPILFGYFQNTSDIFETLFEIEKTKKVLKDMQGENDRVAIKELKTIIQSNEKLLNHFVMDSLYSDKVKWYLCGEMIIIERAHV